MSSDRIVSSCLAMCSSTPEPSLDSSQSMLPPWCLNKVSIWDLSSLLCAHMMCECQSHGGIDECVCVRVCGETAEITWAPTSSSHHMLEKSVYFFQLFSCLRQSCKSFKLPQSNVFVVSYLYQRRGNHAGVLWMRSSGDTWPCGSVDTGTNEAPTIVHSVIHWSQGGPDILGQSVKSRGNNECSTKLFVLEAGW